MSTRRRRSAMPPVSLVGLSWAMDDPECHSDWDQELEALLALADSSLDSVLVEIPVARARSARLSPFFSRARRRRGGICSITASTLGGWSILASESIRPEDSKVCCRLGVAVWMLIVEVIRMDTTRMMRRWRNG